MTASINRLSQTEEAKLEQLYQLQNKREVVKYLNRNPELLPVLWQAAQQIGQLATPTLIELSWGNDPEYPKDQNLAVDIILKGSVIDDELFHLEDAMRDWLVTNFPGPILTKITFSFYDETDDEL